MHYGFDCMVGRFTFIYAINYFFSTCLIKYNICSWFGFTLKFSSKFSLGEILDEYIVHHLVIHNSNLPCDLFSWKSYVYVHHEGNLSFLSDRNDILYCRGSYTASVGEIVSVLQSMHKITVHTRYTL